MAKSIITFTFLILFMSAELFSQCYPAPASLVAWWDADSVFVDSVTDIHNGIKGKLYNGANTDTGVVCNAYHFDGVDDYLLINDDDRLTFSDGTTDEPFSIESWVYVHDMFAFNILSKGAENAREYRFRFTGTNSDHLALGLYDDQRPNGGGINSIGCRSVYTFTGLTNTWIHVAATYDGSGVSSGIKLYVNGVQLNTTVLVGTDSLGGNYVTMRNQSGGGSVGRVFTDFNRFSDGLVDELSVYKGVLTPKQIKDIYNAGDQGKCITNGRKCSITSYEVTNIFPGLKENFVNSTESNISFYPNPSIGKLNIDNPLKKEGDLIIYTYDHKEIYRQQIEGEFNSISLPSHMENGLYLIHFIGNESNEYFRLVLNK